MFERPHHQRIEKLLRALNGDLLQDAQCFFGGGTAIVLLLGEYRESLDVDFLCSSRDGYRLLRNTVSPQGLGSVLRQPLTHLREVRADIYGVRTFVEIDDTPIKIEFISEGRIDVQGEPHPLLGVPTLSRNDMYAEKLLANADRCYDGSTLSRDIIDLAMMMDAWGDVPSEAWQKAKHAYGESVDNAYRAAVRRVSDYGYLQSCLQKMHMDMELLDRIPAILRASSHVVWPDDNGGNGC